MGSFLLLLIVVSAAYLWIRRMRAGRVRWLARLALPGVWSCETADGAILEFLGESDQGTYVERSARATERGRWRLAGSGVVLETSEHGARLYELRLFENGSIGIDGPDRERRIYVRQRSNVVPLRQRQ